MKAMTIDGIVDLRKTDKPLKYVDMPEPVPDDHEILIKVKVCGVCHTELDEIEGRTPPPHFPVVPGHQVVGEVAERGQHANKFNESDRVGVGWIFSSCGTCTYCRNDAENLCTSFKATGRDANGGYAQYMKVHEDYACRIPLEFTDAAAAPLLCAGAIGYRAVRLCGLKDGQNLGFTGFGASAHLALMTVRRMYPNTGVFVFARSENERKFAMTLGADWAGDTEDVCPEKLHCIIDTTPVWKPIVEALARLERGGRLVINAIRKEDDDKEYLKNIHYPSQLWMEKEIKSVANVTRRDISEFLDIAAGMSIKPEAAEYRLADANTALLELKKRNIRGAKVLRID
jgi:propanol-preferring alcohol dehydrogenase